MLRHICIALKATALLAFFVPTPHDYTIRTVICQAELRCAQDLVQKIYFQIRSGIPGNRADGEIVDGNIYKVYLGGIWMGNIESRAAPPVLTNHTTWLHVFFNGRIVRTFSANEAAWHSTTHGFGVNFYGGAVTALINQMLGPILVFRPMDESIAAQLRGATSSKQDR